jgi:hypothetical protein
VAPHKRIRAVRLASQISGKILRRVLIEEDQARERPVAGIKGDAMGDSGNCYELGS